MADLLFAGDRIFWGALISVAVICGFGGTAVLAALYGLAGATADGLRSLAVAGQLTPLIEARKETT